MWSRLTACVKSLTPRSSALQSERRTRRTVLDGEDLDSLIVLLRRLEEGKGLDHLATKLTRLLRTFPPDERGMRHWSLWQQQYDRSGTMYEYAATLLFVLSTDALCDASSHRTITRAHSFP